MPATDIRPSIQDRLAAFASASLPDAAIGLLEVLGYRSERRLLLESNAPDHFIASVAGHRAFNAQQALCDDWRSVDFLFQLTDSEVQDALHIASHGGLLFQSKGEYDGAVIESYLFLAIDLRAPSDRTGERAGRAYTRTELSVITRAVNRLFDMPAGE